MKKNLFFTLFALFSLITSAQINVNYTISPQSERSSISPLIYGFNWTQTSNFTTGQNYSLVRMGGNRATAYNWENNASNAGTDWQNSSDNFWCDYLGIPSSQSEIPGIGMTTAIDQAKNYNAQALITVPMAGYVSADKNGTVTTAAPNSRWCQVVPAKGSAFSLTPNLTDGKVYVDEFVNFLKNKYGSGGVKYSLDNEPDLWKSTHPLVHPNAVTCQELIDKTTATTKAIKAVDANAEIYGFVSYGFTGYMTLQDASDWSSVKGSYSWFIDYYLDQMKMASNTAGTRLVDVLDLHWYPEAVGDQRIINSGANSDNDKVARLQAPRTLWDADYTENSWIGQWFGSYLPLLTKLKTSINSYYPGTKLAFTEFQYGGFEDVTGAISLTDVLGIFGKYGVYAATHWDNPGTYGSLAYKLYRNYDGNNSTYGDVNVSATMNDKVNSSVYASVTSSSDNTLHVVVLNKSLTSAINGTFTISGSAVNYTSASVYAVNNGTASVSKKSDITISGNSFTYSLPALSAYHFILKGGSVTTYTISASAGSGGSVTPSGSVKVNQGANQTFAIAASSGYKINDVTVDGTSVGAVTSYTFTNVTANHTIVASFVAVPKFTITASAGTGGTITPSGAVSVTQGANQTFTIAASTGYTISAVTVDGTSVGALTSYTFTNVTANHTIAATFVANPTFTITASAGTGGTISPSGAVSVNQGANQTFAIAASSGYAISGVTVDGVSVGTVASYTFTNVTANHTIAAAFTTSTCDLLTKYSVPRSTPLPTLANSSYSHSYVLGSGGPSFSNVTNTTINWDLSNKGLWQFSMNTNNGIPSWWINYLPLIKQTFASASPACTLTGSGIAGMDGDYWVNVDGANFVMVAKSGAFALYFTNGAAPTGCPVKSAKVLPEVASTENNTFNYYPNPVDKNGTLTMNIKNVAATGALYYITDMSGKVIMSGNLYTGANSIYLNAKIENGIYIIKIENGDEHYKQKLIVK